jgi:PAS domain S-box-containing protein
MAQDNVRLRRHAIILSFLPDPVVAIGVDGEITFTSMQMERVLQHRAVELIGANIETFIAPDSRADLRRMIEDVVTAEEHAAMEEYSEDTETGDDVGNDANKSDNDDGVVVEGSGGNNSSGSDPNVISSRSSEKSFPMLEVELNSGEGVSDSSSMKPPFVRASTGRDKAPPAKKAKVNVDDVMEASVTANNADAKLSSLRYHKKDDKKKDTDLKSPPEKLQQDQQLQPCLCRKHALAPRTSSSLTEKQECQSSSSESSGSKTKGQVNSSDSGYRQSNESPEDSNESSSSTMSNTDDYVVSSKKEGACMYILCTFCTCLVCWQLALLIQIQSTGLFLLRQRAISVLFAKT